MTTTRNITVRKARNEDYEGVLNITKNFNLGADYIQFSYHELINDPDLSYYVCEVDGEVAAFEGASLLDDNNTIMTRSARVKEKFQGQGLLNLVRKKIYEDHKDVPGKKRIRTCCTNGVRLVHSSTFRSQNRTLAIKRLTMYEPLQVVELPALTDNPILEVQELNTEDLAIIFQNKELVKYLFPDGFISMVSWFFEPLLSNMHHIRKQSPYISISSSLCDTIKKLKSALNTAESQVNHVASVGEEHNALSQGLLLVSTYYCNPAMMYLSMHLYGEPRQGKEEEDVKRIIFHGLQYAISVKEKGNIRYPIALGLTVKETNAVNVAKQLFSSLGFQHGVYETIDQVYFFEQDFEKLLSE